MAQAARKPAQALARSAPAQLTPAAIAIQRLAKLAMAGTLPSHMASNATAIIEAWRAAGTTRAQLRGDIETLQNEIDAGREAAENFVSEAETDGQRRGAQNQVDGLLAVQVLLTKEMERLA